MQIFCPSTDPAVSAASLDDARVIKMVTETAQLLSAAARFNLPGTLEGTCDYLLNTKLYKVPPSGADLWMWAALTDGNWDWLACHGKALLDELDLRRLCLGKLVVPRFLLETFYLPGAKQEVFAHGQGLRHYQAAGFVNRAVNQAKGLDFRHVLDVHEAYRRYLTARWSLEPKAKWTNRKKPEWACEF